MPAAISSATRLSLMVFVLESFMIAGFKFTNGDSNEDDTGAHIRHRK
jgi:hypothetical protein